MVKTRLNTVRSNTISRMLIAGVALLLISIPLGISAQTVLTINKVRDLALEFNRGYLTAQEDINIAQSEITRARADALPQVNVNGSYTRNFKIPSQFIQMNADPSNPLFGGSNQIELQFGNKNNYRTSLSVSQPLWHGGKVFTAYRIARDYKNYSEYIADAVRAGVVLNAETLYYMTMLRKAQLEVNKMAYEANSANFEVVSKKYNQGLVSKYELLRSQVERDNLLPTIIKAESDLNLAQKELKSFIGLELNEDVEIVDEDTDTSLSRIPTLVELRNYALENRPEMKEARLLVEISRRAIRVAKGDYLPNFDAFMDYAWTAQSDDFTLRQNNSRSWTAGVTVSLNIFNGFRTSGNVSQRKAENNQARLKLTQTSDDIKLDVERSYDALIQAKKALDVQKTTIEHAEEGLRIAGVRYESGVGTQLEVISAQTALTSARNQLAGALFNYRQARASLKKATTLDL